MQPNAPAARDAGGRSAPGTATRPLPPRAPPSIPRPAFGRARRCRPFRAAARPPSRGLPTPRPPAMAAAPTTAALRAALDAEWLAATRSHAFLRDVNAGAISAARFNTWLAQARLRPVGRAAALPPAARRLRLLPGGGRRRGPRRRPAPAARRLRLLPGGAAAAAAVGRAAAVPPLRAACACCPAAAAAPRAGRLTPPHPPSPPSPHPPSGLPVRAPLLPPAGRHDRGLPRGRPRHPHRRHGRD
jgi:hypothetical protein